MPNCLEFCSNRSSPVLNLGSSASSQGWASNQVLMSGRFIVSERWTGIFYVNKTGFRVIMTRVYYRCLGIGDLRVWLGVCWMVPKRILTEATYDRWSVCRSHYDYGSCQSCMLKLLLEQRWLLWDSVVWRASQCSELRLSGSVSSWCT